MDPNTARWMNIKRFTALELSQIHEVERTAETAYKAAVLAGKPHRRPNWLESSTAIFDRFNQAQGPYWDRQKIESERGDEVHAFERHIYPLWAPCLRDDKLGDMERMHNADLKIHRDSYTIKRVPEVMRKATATADGDAWEH